jgi:hypothetical protein
MDHSGLEWTGVDRGFHLARAEGKPGSPLPFLDPIPPDLGSSHELDQARISKGLDIPFGRPGGDAEPSGDSGRVDRNPRLDLGQEPALTFVQVQRSADICTVIPSRILPP